MERYSDEYMDMCHAKVDAMNKLMEPYCELSVCIRDLYVLIEAYKICGNELDYSDDFEKIADRLIQIESDGRGYIEGKQSFWLDELMNE